MQAIICQCDITWEDKPANYRRVRNMLTSAAPVISAGALIVLPEMFATGFSMEPERVAEPSDGPTVEWMCEIAARRGAP